MLNLPGFGGNINCAPGILKVPGAPPCVWKSTKNEIKH